MQKTTNYNLNKPEGADFYNVEDFNANADIIDAKLKELEDRKIDIDDTMSATSENPVQNKVIKKYADNTPIERNESIESINAYTGQGHRVFFIERPMAENLGLPNNPVSQWFIDSYSNGYEYPVQMAYELAGAKRICKRCCNNGVWEDWEEIITQSKSYGKNLLLNSDFRVNQRQGKIVVGEKTIYNDADCTNIAGTQLSDEAFLVKVIANGNYQRYDASGSPYGYVKASDVVDGYTGDGVYSVDKWKTVYTKVVIYDKYIKLQGIWGLQQFFDKPLPAGTYTVSIKCRNFSSSNPDSQWAISINANSQWYDEKTSDFKVYTETFTITEDVSTFTIGFNGQSSDASLEIEWVKLELGSIATPFIPRPIGEELALCQRYYQVMNISEFMARIRMPVTQGIKTNWACVLSGAFKTEMIRTPSIILLANNTNLHTTTENYDFEVGFTEVEDANVKKVNTKALEYFIFNAICDHTLTKGTLLDFGATTTDAPFLAFDAEL